jgi:TM2 domain-containing membrane protein YozV
MERILTAILSTILPGAGQLLQHRWVKGVLFLAMAMVISGVVRRQAIQGSSSFALQAILVAMAVWSAVDAYMLAPSKK